MQHSKLSLCKFVVLRQFYAYVSESVFEYECIKNKKKQYSYFMGICGASVSMRPFGFTFADVANLLNRLKQ